MLFSAWSRNSVYPAVLRNDNHRNGLVPRMRCNAPHLRLSALPIRGPWPPRSGSRLCGTAQECCTASGTRCDAATRRSWADFKFQESGRGNSAGTGSSAGNEGVGEHVRTRLHRPGLPVKLRTLDPHRTKKTCFFCRIVFERANSFEIRSSRLT